MPRRQGWILLQALGRILRLARVLTRHALASALGARRPFFLKRWLPPPDLSEPERLRSILEEMGGSMIKLGQMLAFQPDLLPMEYCDALRDLLDRVQPVDTAEIEKVIEDELGRPSAEAFEYFDPEPLASASIGQVHTAVLHDGTKVAVKIQRPEAATAFAGDLLWMRGLVRAITFFRWRRLEWLVEPFGEFMEWTAEELDYHCEARHMKALRSQQEQGAQSKQGTQWVPIVFDELTTRRLLVMEFLDGVTLVAFLRAMEDGDEITLRRAYQAGYRPEIFARNLVDNFIEQVFVHGYYHADLHPANLVIQPGNTVGYLDFGITGRLSTYARHNLVAMTRATATGDMDTKLDAMFRISVADPGADVEGFRIGLHRLAEKWYDIEGGRRRLRCGFTVVMLDMLQLSQETGVWPERDVVKYIRSSMVLDGLLRRVAPDFDLGAYLAEICGRHLRWQNVARKVSARQMADWSVASVRLLLDGTAKLTAILDREAPVEPSTRAVPQTRRLGGPSVLALIFVVCMLVMVAVAEQKTIGYNLVTAQFMLAAAGIVRLLEMKNA